LSQSIDAATLTYDVIRAEISRTECRSPPGVGAYASLFIVSSFPASEEAGDGFGDRAVAGDGVTAGMFEDQRVRERSARSSEPLRTRSRRDAR
jgi:hypothetical protein